MAVGSGTCESRGAEFGDGEFGGDEPKDKVVISNADIQCRGISTIGFSWEGCTVSRENILRDVSPVV